MSYIHVPDLHPGRCQNHRSIVHADGFSELLRCLDYAGTDHVCEFPKPSHVVVPRDGWSGNIYTHPQPKPWVKP